MFPLCPGRFGRMGIGGTFRFSYNTIYGIHFVVE